MNLKLSHISFVEDPTIAIIGWPPFTGAYLSKGKVYIDGSMASDEIFSHSSLIISQDNPWIVSVGLDGWDSLFIGLPVWFHSLFPFNCESPWIVPKLECQINEYSHL